MTLMGTHGPEIPETPSFGGLVTTDDMVAARKRLMEFTDEDEALLRQFSGVATAGMAEIADELRAYLNEHRDTAALLSERDTEEQAEHLRSDHLSGLTAGTVDADYLIERMRMAARHERLGVKPTWLLGAYNRFLCSAASRICESSSSSDPERALATLLALQRLVFLDIGLAADIYLAKREHSNREQQRAVSELPTPVLQLIPGLLVVPIVGELDDRRALNLTNQLMAHIRNSRAQAAVVDITGLPSIDLDVAAHLITAVKACALLGAEVIFTGLSAEVARTLVDISPQKTTLITFVDLQSGVEHATQTLGYEMVMTWPLRNT
ncbi:Stressosome protein rsbRA [Nocardia asteroides]|nr:Anti-anti-sigma regulatory factor (antagonist of anti-sigma factor) [Nocardia asteroides]VEG36373.1 Stressosome protein rsbRA [Nocardia asteroides]